MIDLVTDVGPDAKYAGGQVLERLIRFTPSLDFDVHILDQGHLEAPRAVVPNWKIRTQMFVGESRAEVKVKSLFRLVFFFAPSLGARISSIFLLFVLLFKGLKIARRLNSSSSETCWLVLQGQRIVVLYIPVFLLVRKRIVLHQWDPIDWWMKHQGAGPRIIRAFESIVGWMARKADINIVPSDRWKAAIEAQGGRAVRVDNFFNENEISSHVGGRNFPDNEVHAVFVGQIYALDELNELIGAFKAGAATLKLNPVLHYYGASNVSQFWMNIRIVEHGFVSRDQLLIELGDYDFALLPYPKNEAHDTTARFSFPSKSRVYIASGLPILANCGLSSSPHEFYGPSLGRWYLNITETPAVARFIEECMRSETRHLCRHHCENVARSAFSSKVELAKFQQAMGCVD